MLIITFRGDGIPFPDWSAEESVLSAFRNGDQFLNTSTENVIHAARCLILEGVIPVDEIQFRFQEAPLVVHILKHNSAGRLKNWPEGFCDYAENWYARLLDNKESKQA